MATVPDGKWFWQICVAIKILTRQEGFQENTAFHLEVQDNMWGVLEEFMDNSDTEWPTQSPIVPKVLAAEQINKVLYWYNSHFAQFSFWCLLKTTIAI